MDSKLKIIFLGTPNYLDPIINSLSEHFNLLKTIRKTEELNHESIKQFNNLKPDLLVVASFGKIIPQEILKTPKLGAINIHPSKLPHYRGPSPIQSQIIDGVTDSAISFILMDQEMDHGPLIYQEPFEIKQGDTFESLLTSMFQKSADILPIVIQSLTDNKLSPIDQNHNEATFCKEIQKGDGYFDIENPPTLEVLNRMIRAYYPWPGTWTKWNNKIVKFLPNSSPITLSAKQASSAYNSSPYLLQMEGKSPADLKSFLNGYPTFPLKSLITE